MKYEVGPFIHNTDYYSAETTNEAGEGEIYTTVFFGSRSKERAEEFVSLEAELTRTKKALEMAKSTLGNARSLLIAANYPPDTAGGIIQRIDRTIKELGQ